MDQATADRIRRMIVRLQAVISATAESAAAIPHPKAERTQALAEIGEEQAEAILTELESALSQRPVAA